MIEPLKNVLEIMCWKTKDTYQFILDSTSRKTIGDIQTISISSGGENNQPSQDILPTEKNYYIKTDLV